MWFWVGSALTLGGPLLRFQHEMLLGLLQLLLQPVVLGPHLRDPLLSVLQDLQLSTEVHHLLRTTHGTVKKTTHTVRFSSGSLFSSD